MKLDTDPVHNGSDETAHRSVYYHLCKKNKEVHQSEDDNAEDNPYLNFQPKKN